MLNRKIKNYKNAFLNLKNIQRKILEILKTKKTKPLQKKRFIQIHYKKDF